MKLLRWLMLLLQVYSYSLVSVGSVQDTRPNIILILADDLGFGDLSVPPFNSNNIRTPNLEQLAKDGLRLLNFHTAAPICTPSRAAILTGLFPWRMGIYSIYGTGPQSKEHLLVVPNLANLLNEYGYNTIHVGKWHLGTCLQKFD